MKIPFWLPWCFTALSLSGAYLNARGRLLESSVMWFVANLFWLYLDATRELWAQCALYLAFIGTNILGCYTALKPKAYSELSHDD